MYFFIIFQQFFLMIYIIFFMLYTYISLRQLLIFIDYHRNSIQDSNLPGFKINFNNAFL